MEDNGSKENSDVGSSSIPVLDSANEESEAVRDISQEADIQETKKREEDGQEEEEEAVPIVSGMDVTNVQLVDENLLLVDNEGGLPSDGASQAVVILETDQMPRIYEEDGTEPSSEDRNDRLSVAVPEQEAETDQNEDYAVPIEQSVASCSNSVNLCESHGTIAVNEPSEEIMERINEGPEGMDAVESVDGDDDVSRSPDENNRFEEEVGEVGGVAVVSYSVEEQNGGDIGEQRDQESQVVPDSSAVVSSERRFLNENLHEMMEVVTNTDRAVSLEMQMVPTSSEDNASNGEEEIRDTNVEGQHERIETLPESIHELPNEVPIGMEDSGDAVPVLETEDDGQSSSVTTEVTAEGQQAVVPVLEETITSEVENTVQLIITEPTTTVPNSQAVHSDAVTSYLLREPGNIEILQSDDRASEEIESTLQLALTEPTVNVPSSETIQNDAVPSCFVLDASGIGEMVQSDDHTSKEIDNAAQLTATEPSMTVLNSETVQNEAATDLVRDEYGNVEMVQTDDDMSEEIENKVQSATTEPAVTVPSSSIVQNEVFMSDLVRDVSGNVEMVQTDDEMSEEIENKVQSTTTEPTVTVPSSETVQIDVIMSDLVRDVSGNVETVQTDDEMSEEIENKVQSTTTEPAVTVPSSQILHNDVIMSDLVRDESGNVEMVQTDDKTSKEIENTVQSATTEPTMIVPSSETVQNDVITSGLVRDESANVEIVQIDDQTSKEIENTVHSATIEPKVTVPSSETIQTEVSMSYLVQNESGNIEVVQSVNQTPEEIENTVHLATTEPTIIVPSSETGQNDAVTSYPVRDESGNVDILQNDDHAYEGIENTIRLTGTEPIVAVPSSQILQNDAATSYLARDQSNNVEMVQSEDHTYEVCVTIPNDNPGGDNSNTVPFAMSDQVQEIPIELSDWSNFGEQSLVAITEDGRTIPLTVVRHGPRGELVYQTEGNEVQLSSEILQQLANSHFLDGSVIDANIGDGSGGAVEVIEMLQSEDGTVILESADGSVPSTSSQQQQIFYTDTTMAEGEHSILPDVMEDMTNVIHIPDNAYLSGQPFEVQFIDVAKEVPVANDKGASRSLLKEQLLAPQRRRPTAPNPTSVRQSRTTRPIYARAAEKMMISNKAQKVTKKIPVRNEIVAQETPTEDNDDDGGDSSSQIELSNTTPSVISPENMQELIQILQSLPLSARGQTIQIILQSSVAPTTTTAATNNKNATQMETDNESRPQSAPCRPPSPKPIVRIGDNNIVPFIKMVSSRSRNRTTTDIAIQVNPEFIDDEQTAIEDEIAEATVIQPPIEEIIDETVAVTDELESADLNPVDRQISEDDRSKAIIEAIMESSRKKRPYRKKNSNKIVTLQEQWVVDPKPGVSYYAVVDYLSEHDQDGFSSASEMKRPEAPSSDFMEDHLELQNMEVDHHKARSILESTIDSSVVVSPFRRGRNQRAFQIPRVVQTTSIDLPNESDQSSVTLKERTFEQAQLEEENLAVGPMPDIIQRRKRRGGRVRAVKVAEPRLNHRCGYCTYDSSEKLLVVEHCIRDHSDQPVKTLSLLPRTVGRMCPYCHQLFDHSEFFSHMRCAHNEVHPYKCGYCDFMGRDRNQIRHHIQKKHRLPIKVINLLEPAKKQTTNEAVGRKRIMALSEGEDTVYEYLTDEEELEDDDSDNTSARRGLICPECKKTFKTLKYLKTHIKIHQAHRYQCGYCDFISIMLHQVLRHCQKKHGDVDPKVLTKELEPEKNPIISRDIDNIVKKVFSLNTRLPRDPDATKWMRKWFCPHCDYTCQFGASYRRHLRMHANILPYKCNYCSFKGREKYYVRRHITRMHAELPVIVVENTPENCAGDTSSDEDFQEKGLRRKRRRRTKDQLHTVVPVEEIDPDEFQEQYQMQPIREARFGRFASEDSQNVPPPTVKAAARYEDDSKRMRAAFVSRLNDEDMWSGENISDYIREKEGDKIVCKVCGQKTLAKTFHKHARKHFKVKPFKCGYCNYISIEKSKIRVHNTLKHPNLPLKTEECHLASLAPQDFMDLIGGESDGENQTANANSAANNTPQFVCPLCQSQVEYDEKILSEHFYGHFEYFPYQCSECDHQNVSEEKVVEHGTSHDSTFAVYETGQTKPEGLEETIQQFLKEGQELVQRRLQELMDQRTVQSSASETEETSVKIEKSPIHLFLCPICDRQMNLNAVTVRRHLYSHYGYKPFKCGHCSYMGVSKAKVRQHASTHGSVQPKIDITDELMPEDLAKMLREIYSQMKQLPHSTSSLRGREGEQRRNEKSSSPDTNPTSTEGKIWHEMLSKGECPWCRSNLGSSSFNKLRDHLLGHFHSKPYRCGHCDEEFTRRNEVNQHIIKKHPNQELKITDLDEETIRKGLRIYMKLRKAIEATRTSSVTPEAEKKVETSSKQQNEDKTVENNGNDAEDLMLVDKSTSLPNEKIESSEDDGDIMTVEGVLLTRTFRSETEASSDEDRDRDSENTESDDDDEDVNNEEDFLVGDVALNFVMDIVNILKKSSFASSNVEPVSDKLKNKFNCDQCQRKFNKQQGLLAHITKVHSSRPREEEIETLFVCGYCEFCSSVETETQTHMEENHSDKPILFKKEPKVQQRRGGGIRRRGGGRGRKRPPLLRQSTAAKRVRTNTGAAKPANDVSDEQEEEETLENITKMVQSSTRSNKVAETVDETSKVCRYPLRGKGKSEQPVLNRETLTSEPSSSSLSEIVTTEETPAKATTSEKSLETEREELHPLTPLVPNMEEESCMESLENLEECDENLPKILHILQLRPAMDDIDGNT